MRQVQKGSTNVSVDVYIIDDTDGTPETGVLFNTAGMDLEYRRESSAVVNVTEVTLAALTTAHTDGGFLEIGHGVYRFDLPDAAFATGADTVSIQGTVTGMVILPQTIQIVDFNPNDSVRLGLTALPNAAADAAGGLPISDAGGLDLDTQLANTDEITAARLSELDAATAGKMANQVDIIQTDTTTDIPASISALNDLSAAQVNAEVDTALSDYDGPTNAEMNARTLLAADYFDPALDAVANVTLVATTTTNTDMRGTDSAATAANLATVDSNVDAILVDTSTTIPAQISGLNDLSSADVDTALATYDGPTNAEMVARTLAAADYFDPSADTVANVTLVGTTTTNTDMISVSDILTTQMSQSYAADGVAPTLAQALFLIQQSIGDFTISGTTISVKQLDGSTNAATYTLDDGTNPTSRTRAT